MDFKKITLAGGGVTTIVGAGAGTFFLTQNKTTIKDRLISKNIKLISSDAEYLPAFKEYKDEESFKNLIKEGSNEANSWNEQQWAEALKKWCDKNLVLKSAENQENVEKYCTKPPLTIKERIEKRGKKVVTDWNDEKLEEMMSSDFQFFIDFTLETSISLNRFDDKSRIKAALIQWCTNNIKTELNNTNTNNIWAKVQKRCLDS